MEHSLAFPGGIILEDGASTLKRREHLPYLIRSSPSTNDQNPSILISKRRSRPRMVTTLEDSRFFKNRPENSGQSPW
jgi:hypothetical protein